MQIKTHTDLIKAVGKHSPRGARWMMEEAETGIAAWRFGEINYVESIYLTSAFLWYYTPQGYEFWCNIDNKIYESVEYDYA